MEAIEQLQDEGINVLGGSQKKEESGFEKSTVAIASAMHNPPTPATAELHGNISKNLLSSVFEMHIIENAMKTEHKMMTEGKTKTISPTQEAMNKAYLDIVEESDKNLMRELAALDGRSRNDANQDMASLVGGEQAKQMAQFPLQVNEPGTFARFGNWLRGKK